MTTLAKKELKFVGGRVVETIVFPAHDPEEEIARNRFPYREVYGPLFESKYFNPHFKNCGTGEPNSHAHHDRRTGAMSRKSFMGWPPQYGFCLEFITLPERGRERCLQEFFNDSPGCGTHKSTFGFTINNVFDKMRRGQRVFWGDIEDPLIKAARQMPDPYATAAMAKQLVVAAAEAHADAKYAEKGYIEEDDGAHTIFEKMKKEQMWAAKSKKQEDQQMEQEQRKQKGGYVKNPRGGAFVIAGPRGSSKPPKAALGAVATRDHSSILKAPLGAVAAINGYNQNIIAPVNDADAGPTPAMRAISWANNLPTPAQNDGAASAFEDKKMAMREKLEEKWLNGGKSKSKTLLNRHDKNNRTWKGRPKNPPLPETPEEGENVTETQEEQKDRGFESIVAGVSKIDIAKGKNKGKKKARK